MNIYFPLHAFMFFSLCSLFLDFALPWVNGIYLHSIREHLHQLKKAYQWAKYSLPLSQGWVVLILLQSKKEGKRLWDCTSYSVGWTASALALTHKIVWHFLYLKCYVAVNFFCPHKIMTGNLLICTCIWNVIH